MLASFLGDIQMDPLFFWSYTFHLEDLASKNHSAHLRIYEKSYDFQQIDLKQITHVLPHPPHLEGEAPSDVYIFQVDIYIYVYIYIHLIFMYI